MLGRCLLAALFVGCLAGPAAAVDLSRAVVVAPRELSAREKKAVAMLVDEVAKRTHVRLPVQTGWPKDERPAIGVASVASLDKLGGELAAEMAKQSPDKAEGFRVRSDDGSVVVAGNDERGVLFGIGYLLRHLRMGDQRLALADNLDVTTAPAYPLRGHQLGYRPKTNSYDAWDLKQWEQYYRDLAVFGCNAVELIPPRSDDAPTSPHFPLPQIEMMEGMSRLADDYGLDVWIWYPAMDRDYGNPATVESALKEWEVVYKRLPRIDALFVPGGDPGHTQPVHLMALLEKQTALLKKYHPQAQMWMSPQGFTREWMDEYFDIMPQRAGVAQRRGVRPAGAHQLAGIAAQDSRPISDPTLPGHHA